MISTLFHARPLNSFSAVSRWGINYYSYPCVSTWFAMGAMHDEPVFDNFFRLHPEGLYESIHDASCLQRPIYITGG